MSDNRSSSATADTATVTSDFSFVEAMEIDTGTIARALSLSGSPRHDTIGLGTTKRTTQVCATAKARELPDDDEQALAPVDIIVALDVSGSMTGEKLQQCKKTLEFLLRVLLPRDRFGLVSFATEAVIEIPAQLMTAENKNAALEKIKSLHTRGSTNISAAIGLASQEMNMIENPNEVRSIFLLTDGHANGGITDAPGIVEATKNCLVNDISSFDTDTMDSKTETSGKGGFGSFFKKRAAASTPPPKDVTVKSEPLKTPPINLFCFGYGKDHDSDFLRQIANATPGGTYYFVENDSNVGSAFGDALGGLLSCVAQNAVVTIKVPPEASALGVEIVDVYHAQKLKRDNGSYSVTVGDFYAEESRDVVFEVTLATPLEGSSLSSIPHAEITLAYTDAIQKRPVKTAPVVCAVSRPEGNQISEANQHVLVQWLRIYATQEMTEAEKLGNQQNLPAAQARIQKALETIQNTPGVPQSDPLVVQLTAELKQVLQGFSSRHEYARVGGHYTRRTIQSHAMQRCSEATHSSASVYRGSRKMKMAKAFNNNTK